MFMWTPRYNGSDLYNRWMGWKMNFLITSHLIIDNDCSMIGPFPADHCLCIVTAAQSSVTRMMFPRLGMHSQNVRNSDSFHASVNLIMNGRRNWKFDLNILTFVWTPQETRTMNAFHGKIETKDVFPIKMWTTCKMKILSPAEEWNGM